MLSLVWRARALADLEEITGYIAERNRQAADMLQAAVERLPEHPYLYRPGRIEGTREAVVHPNCIVIYRVRADAIEIVGVIHARRRYP